MTKNENEPAFPIAMDCENQYGFKYQHVYTGLTKREHYAGLAMQALITAQLTETRTRELPLPAQIAKWSIQAADSLLEQLEASNDPNT